MKRRGPEPIKPPEFVYVLSLFGYHKIGRSKNVEKRLLAFSATILPETPKIVLKRRVYSGPRVESYLHKLFAAQRVQGEWFKLSDSDLEEIDSILKAKEEPCGCILYDGGPPKHCAEAARLRREMGILKEVIPEVEFMRLPYVQHFLGQ